MGQLADMVELHGDALEYFVDTLQPPHSHFVQCELLLRMQLAASLPLSANTYKSISSGQLFRRTWLDETSSRQSTSKSA